MSHIDLNRQTLHHFWQISLQERPRLILTCICMPLYALAINTFLPLYVGKVLAGLGHGESAGHYLPYLIVSATVGVIANYVGFKAFLTLQPKTMQRLETEALDALLKRGVSFHNNSVAGKLVSDTIEYPTAYQQLSNILATTIVPIVVSLVSGIIVVLCNSLLLGVLVIIMTVGVLAFASWQTLRSRTRREQRHAARRAMIAQQADVITNSVTVKTFAREPAELTEHRRLNQQLATYRIRDWTKVATDGSRRIGLLLTFEIGFILLVIHLVQRSPALLGIGIFTFSYVLNLTNRLFDVGSIFRTIEDALLEAQDMTNIISTEPEVLDVLKASKLRVRHGAIVFHNVSFQYPDATTKEYVFQGLNLSIKAGEKVGLVGPSGGGKSTLSRLLLRFEDIQEGTITIDDQSIASISQASLRQAIAYVPQEPLLFHRSVLENIAYSKPSATVAQVRTATSKAHALEFIDALPNGFNTVVGERGVKLSGGQRQRVAIARALLKDAPLLVLDEATSALDSESERLIQQALWKLMANKTAIVIAHRLSTIQRLDRIVVLDKGQIIEDGSHTELLKQKGLYAKLWAHQSGGFIDD